MSKLSKKDIEELEDFLSRGCAYSGTQEVIKDIITEVLRQYDCNIDLDEAYIINLDDVKICSIEDFINNFWDKAVEKILNVVETQ